MDPWFGIFLYFCHAAIVAYFLFLTNAEAREQERRRDGQAAAHRAFGLSAAYPTATAGRDRVSGVTGTIDWSG